MSYYPSPEARRGRVRKTLKRWEEKFPTAMVRHMVEDAHKYEHSPYKREVYASWIKDHECRDYTEEYMEVLSFYDAGPSLPMNRPASVEENVQDFKAFLQAPPEDLPTTEEGIPMQEVEYLVNKSSAPLEAGDLEGLGHAALDPEGTCFTQGYCGTARTSIQDKTGPGPESAWDTARRSAHITRYSYGVHERG